jgi:hypothetical protein
VVEVEVETDCQQFHHYQQITDLSSQIIEHKKDHEQVLAWDRHKNVVGLNRKMGSQPFSS